MRRMVSASLAPGGWTRRGLATVALFAAWCGVAAPTGGQTVYRWTDEKGVVHFSDSSPPKGTKYERHRLPAAPAVAVTGRAPTPEAKGNDVSAQGEAESAAAASGPARVILKDEHVEQAGPSAREFSGTVKNVGGAEAGDVYIAITVTNLDQGDECVQDEIAVVPSTLAPDATGVFAATLDTPCFFGNAGVDLVPEWR